MDQASPQYMRKLIDAIEVQQSSQTETADSFDFKTVIPVRANEGKVINLNITDVHFTWDDFWRSNGGNMRIYFDSNQWDIERYGFIYGDSSFIDHLVKYFQSIGIDSDSFDYDEHGMQGTDYVSLDIGRSFIEALIYRFPDLDDPDNSVFET